MGNQMGEKMSSADVVRQNLQQGNSMPQHSPGIPGTNSSIFDSLPSMQNNFHNVHYTYLLQENKGK